MCKLKQWVKSSLDFQFFVVVDIVVLADDGDVCVHTHVSTLVYANMGTGDVQVPWSVSGG